MSLVREQNRRAHIALNRFGLGAKPGGILRIRADAKAALEAELNQADIALINRPGLPVYGDACKFVHTDGEDILKERELTARIAQHLQPEIGFVERLVLFFSNHFSMSVNKDGAIRATIGQLEREVIRADVLGSFSNMLVGVMKHPAMLCYLDNDDSIGPRSVAGRAWGAGLNHNLAREIFELHTLGVNGGYTENDIDSLAKVLTGWSFVRGWEADGRYNGGNSRNRGKFIYRADWHEPGTQVILGKSYTNLGKKQCQTVLNILGRHPATAQFIAFKLIRHFITEDVTPEMVAPVAQAFRSSGGNLKATAQALIDLPQAWSLPLKKMRTPYELQIAEMRALNRDYPPDNLWPFNSALDALRHSPWQHLTPDGYTDDDAYWMGSDAMRIRLETAQMNARTLMQISLVDTTPLQLADRMFATALSAQSRNAVATSPTKQYGLTALFMIPEFQRR